MRRTRTNSRKWLLALGLVGLLPAACALHEPASLPSMVLPQHWNEPLPASSAVAGIKAEWWKGFHSPELNRLVDLALSGNLDLLISAERLRQAELALQITGASRLPNVGMSAGSSQAWSKTEGQDTSRRDSSNLGLSMSYELDLWGRLAANVAADAATLQASRYDDAAVRLSLVAGVADVYFQALATRERLRLAEENLQLARRILAIVESRWGNGVATSLEVSQQQTTVLSQQAALIPLTVQIRQSQSALALLLGQVPQGDVVNLEAFDTVRIPVVRPEMPPVLITRRPDIASLESTLAAADADVAAARAALLPSGSLSAAGGLNSALLLDLADPTRSLSIALSLAQNIFDGGRLRLQAEQVRSQRAVQVIRYAQAVRTALKEVDDGLGNVEKNKQQTVAQQALLDQAMRSLRLAELRYRQGSGELLSVLEAQRTVFTARDQLVTLRLSQLQATIDLSKALGGGWLREA